MHPVSFLAQVRRFTKYNLGQGLEKKSNDFAAEVAQQTQAKAPAAAAAAEQPKKEEKKEEPAKPAVQISAGLVKQLRDKSGAGMMDCKRALAECSADLEAASEVGTMQLLLQPASSVEISRCCSWTTPVLQTAHVAKYTIRAAA